MRAMSKASLNVREAARRSGLGRALRVPVLADLAVSVDLPAALDHHVAVFLLGHAGHRSGHLLKALAVGRADLGKEVDVAAERHHPVEIAVEDRLLLLLGHLPLVEIGALVSLEAGAVLGLHQGHAELVQPVALARLLRVEDDRAGDVSELLVERHFSLSSPPASRAASDCRSAKAPEGRPQAQYGE